MLEKSAEVIHVSCSIFLTETLSGTSAAAESESRASGGVGVVAPETSARATRADANQKILRAQILRPQPIFMKRSRPGRESAWKALNVNTRPLHYNSSILSPRH